MKYETHEEQGVLVVALDGDVDLESSPVARKVLLDCVGRNDRVLIDLAKVGYMDSSGVASLVESLQHARKRGCAFALAAANDMVGRVISLARLDKVFNLHTTVREGVEALR